MDQDLEGVLKAYEGEDQINPENVAIIKFSPSAENPHAEYADEIYYPPISNEQNAAREIILPSNAVDGLYIIQHTKIHFCLFFYLQCTICPTPILNMN